MHVRETTANSDEGAAGLAGENLAGRFEPDSRF